MDGRAAWQACLLKYLNRRHATTLTICESANKPRALVTPSIHLSSFVERKLDLVRYMASERGPQTPDPSRASTRVD